MCVAGVGGGRSLFCVLILCSRKRVSLCSPNVFSSIVRPSERAYKRVWLFVVSVPLVESLFVLNDSNYCRDEWVLFG